MGIEYTTKQRPFSFDYQELKDDYVNACLMSDEDFKSDIPEILHLSCIICYIKGLSNDDTIGDCGIIHELIHLLNFPDDPNTNLSEIRALFNETCKLS